MHRHVVSDPELCQAALREVLESQTFARAEQLRNFLKYVCEKTVFGNSADIKEYSVGVDALGRGPGYSPSNDSSVRRRAYEIRQRLEQFYSIEMPHARVRIELPKGSYVPVFVEMEPVAVSKPAAADQEPAQVAPSVQRAGVRVNLLIASASIFIFMGTLVSGWRAWSSAAQPRIEPIVREFWGPLLEAQSHTLICQGGSLYMLVRTAPFPDNAGIPSFPAPNELYETYGQIRPLPPGARLYMRQVENVASIGAVSGIAVAAGMLRLAGAVYRILPERTAPLASFPGRNVILFGDPLTSQAAVKELGRAYLTIAYDGQGTRLVIRDRRKPPTAPPVFSRKPEAPSGTLEAFGLITALPTEGSGSTGHRTFVISGVSNAGIHGAMEFLASPERLQNLKERFGRQGLSTIPASYQVVVKCYASKELLLSYEYASHEVIDPKVAAELP